MKRLPTEIEKELDRFRVAWNTGLQSDVEPISRLAVMEGIEVLKALPDLLCDIAQVHTQDFLHKPDSLLSEWERGVRDRFFAVQAMLEGRWASAQGPIGTGA